MPYDSKGKLCIFVFLTVGRLGLYIKADAQVEILSCCSALTQSFIHITIQSLKHSILNLAGNAANANELKFHGV